MVKKVDIVNGDINIYYYGPIKLKDDFLDVKNAIEPLIDPNYPCFHDEEMQPKKDPKIRIFFYKSYPLSSYIIGYLLKLHEVNKLEIEIVTEDPRVYNSCTNLGLKLFFEVNYD